MFAYLFEAAKAEATETERKTKIRQIIAKFVKPDGAAVATR